MDKENGVFGSVSFVSIATILSMAFGGTWALFQTQLTSVEHEITASQLGIQNEARHNEAVVTARLLAIDSQVSRIDAELFALVQKAAREPVEKSTIDATNLAVQGQIGLIQGQITDINRQIAAALIIIDNNAQGTVTKRTTAGGALQ